jgi:hypothetical protein
MSYLVRFLFAAFVALAAVCAAEDSVSRLPTELQVPLESKDYLNSTQDGWTMYKQCDSQWSGQKLGTCSDTICSAGCAMSSVAMMLKTKGTSKDPSTLNSWLKSNGGYSSGCLINWASVNAFKTVTYIGKQHPNESEICNGLKSKHGLIANVHNGGHWVLLTGCNGGGVYRVNDPGYSTTTYKHSDIKEIAVYH